MVSTTKSIVAVMIEPRIARMAKPRAAADAQNSRVKWWAIVQTVILFSICAVNVHVLKSWFEVKRVL